MLLQVELKVVNIITATWEKDPEVIFSDAAVLQLLN